MRSILSPAEEEARLVVLRSYRIMDTPPEAAFDDLAELAAQVCGAAVALICLADERRLWVKARWGTDLAELPRPPAWAATSGWSVEAEAGQEPPFRKHPLASVLPDVHFFAEAPLVSPEGARLGVLWVGDTVSRELSAGQRRALEVVAKQVLAQLELRRAASMVEERDRLLRASEARLQALVAVEDSCVKLLEPNGRLCEINEAGLHLLEAESVESVRGRCMVEIVAEEHRAMVRAMLEAVAKGERSTIQCRITTLKGLLRLIEIKAVPFRDEVGGTPLVLALSRDISRRKQAEEKVQRLNRLYTVSSAVSTVIVRVREVQELYERVCRIAVEQGGLLMAWVGLVDAASDTILPIARWGQDAGYLERLTVSTRADVAEGLGPAGVAIRTGQPACCNEIHAAQETFASWQEAVERGYRSCAAFPLTVQGKVVGMMVVYSQWSGYFDTEELQLLNSMAENLSFAVESQEGEANRRRAETALHESEERLVQTLEGLTEGFFTLDREWRFTYANHEGRRMIRRSTLELIGGVWWEVFPETVGNLTQQRMEWALRENVAIQFEVYFSSLEGWYELRAFPSAQGLAVYTRDVNDQRKTMENLRISEERFRLLSQATNDAIWDWDLITEEIWWNEGLQTLFGYNSAEVEPTNEWWASRIHPDERARAEQTIRQVIAQGSGTWVARYRFRCRDGHYASVLDRGYIIQDGAGRAVRMIGCMTDLTGQMLAEERIAEQAALLDKARDAILVRDLEHRITYCNKSAERLYGYRADELLGRTVREVLYEHPETFDEATQHVMADGEWVGELAQIGRNGKRLTVEGRWTLVRDESGAPRSVLAINTDITERKELEQQFFRAQRMESIGTLAGGIAHDLNNALSPVIMGLDLLKLRIRDEVSLDTLEIIGTSARRGADMVRQVLSFARGVEGLRVEVGVKHLLREIEKIANDTFLKHIRVRTLVPPDLWLVVGDPTQLHQVLLNLAVNARDAMPRGGTLTLSAENVVVDAHTASLNLGARSGPHLLLRVEDTGTGIASALVDKIFDPFFTTKDVGQGTGLGLSTSLAIVKSHGGFIRVETEPGKGTVFRVYLPARIEPVLEGGVAGAPALPRGQGELILVVDDEPNVRDIARRTLEAFGYRVVLASDGLEATSLCAQQGREIAVVLTDMMMPGMDGPTTIRTLRAIHPNLPIIASSGLSARSYGDKLTGLGVQHFLPKPYTTEALLAVLQQVLRK